DWSSGLLVALPRLHAGGGRQGLLSQRRQDRHHEREHEENDDGNRDDRAMVRVQPAEAHAGIPTASGGVAGAPTRCGRMAHTLMAKTTWAPAISRPPTVLQSHIGSAAITEAMKDWPATHARPWRIPAAEVAITYVRIPTRASQKGTPTASGLGSRAVRCGTSP